MYQIFYDWDVALGIGLGHDSWMNDDTALFTQTLVETLAPWHISATSEQLQRLAQHYTAMVAFNQVTNLTRIIKPVEAAIKHYADSLALLAWSNERSLPIRSVLDVGTGAGFPAVPLAIMRPTWNITAIDGTAKKIEFVRDWASASGIANVCCVHAHSKHWETDKKFDLVTCRALAKLESAIEQTAPFVQGGGHLVLYKSASITSEELQAGNQAAHRNGLSFLERYDYSLKVGSEVLARTLLIYQLANSP